MGMGHMAKAEATFQKCRKMLKIDEAKLSKTMQINSGLTTALADKQRKEKLASTKAQGSNKKWLRESLKKCHATEVDIHNKWVSGSQKGKMNLELCRRAGKVALKMEQNKCAR